MTSNAFVAFNSEGEIVSWRSGAQFFREMWPLIQAHAPDATLRHQFLCRLLTLFLEWDIDPENIADVHSEVRAALAALGETEEGPSNEDDVAICVRQLSSMNERACVTAAQAIEFFVHQADDPVQAAKVALSALVAALSDARVAVRRAAAKSIDELLAAQFALPSRLRKKLRAAAADVDDVVKKRIAGAVKRVEKSAKRGASQKRGTRGR